MRVGDQMMTKAGGIGNSVWQCSPVQTVWSVRVFPEMRTLICLFVPVRWIESQSVAKQNLYI